MKNVSLERLMIRSIRAFQEKMMSTSRNAEIRNISTQEGTGSRVMGWKDATFEIEYVENDVYHKCYISVTQTVPGGYVYEEGEAQA